MNCAESAGTARRPAASAMRARMSSGTTVQSDGAAMARATAYVESLHNAILIIP